MRTTPHLRTRKSFRKKANFPKVGNFISDRREPQKESKLFLENKASRFSPFFSLSLWRFSFGSVVGYAGDRRSKSGSIAWGLFQPTWLVVLLPSSVVQDTPVCWGSNKNNQRCCPLLVYSSGEWICWRHLQPVSPGETRKLTSNLHPTVKQVASSVWLASFCWRVHLPHTSPRTQT